MHESTLDNTLYYTNRVSSIRLGQIVSACLGFLLIFIAPYGDGYFKDWLIPLTSSYRISLFEAFAIPIICGGLIYYGIRIKKSEKSLLLSIILVILSRIVSIVAAEGVKIEQWISLFRYIETLFIIYIFTNLFADKKNRNFFTMGIIIGVAVESVGGLYIFITKQGRGVFISNYSSILQAFLIIACILDFIYNKRHKFLMSVSVLIMIAAIFVTLSRTSWILLIISILVFVLIYSKRRIKKYILFFIILTGIAALLIEKMLPSYSEVFISRTESAFSGGGSILYRFYLFDMSIASFLQHPILGIGSGSFVRQQAHLPQVFHFNLPLEYSNMNLQLSTHNTFLGILSETGIIGLGAYLLWVIAVIGICRRVFRLSNNIDLRDDKYVIATAIIIITFIIGDVITQCSFTPISSAFIGFELGWLREKNKIRIESELAK